jgi:hypothetical protein
LNPGEELDERVASALGGVNRGIQALDPSDLAPGQRSAGSQIGGAAGKALDAAGAVLGVNPISIGHPAPGAALAQARNERQWSDNIVHQIITAPDSTSAEKVMDDAMAEAKRGGLDSTQRMQLYGPWLRAFYGGRARAAAGVSGLRGLTVPTP